MSTTSDVIVDALARAGIRYVFGYPGGQNMRFIEAMRGSPVEFVLVTHEGCAGFMADVTARLTGRPGACLSTLGPGATNLTTGVGNAFLDRVPMLAFTGTMGRRWKGRTVQMQIDHRRLFAPITKWSAEIRSASACRTMGRALEIAQAEQPGPVHLDFPEDVAEENAKFRTPHSECRTQDAGSRTAGPLPENLAQIEELLRAARRPLVAVGLTMNRAGATESLRALVERHRLPVVSTMMAKGQVEESSPTFVGVLGRARRNLVAEFCEPADLVLAIGYDPVEFNYEDWVRKDLPIIHVDSVPADLDDEHTLAAQAVGDLGPILRHLAHMPPLEHEWDLEAVPAHRKKLREALTPPGPGFRPHQVLEAMRDALPGDGIIVSDVGAHTHLIGQLWDTRGAGKLLVSNGWSSMGFCVPAAIAAKLVRPSQAVAACTGDGGFLMMAGEVNTAVRLRLPVVFVVLRDRYLSLIRVKQNRRGFPWAGVELLGENYRASDNLFGAPVVVTECEEAFRAAFAAALGSSGPTVIEAVVDPGEYDEVV
ncbi:MAG: thiamine pyrophosphate-binding protein [Acidobacteria bacterium]|nr:MAG: thiamine pyrophosphate-binding protein [Acidobacteriota bacterium]